MLKLGNKSISNLFIGQKAATKAFLGQKLVWQKATGLPYDAEVEYLESTGTQWIDTGVVWGENIGVKVKAISTSSSNSIECVVGAMIGDWEVYKAIYFSHDLVYIEEGVTPTDDNVYLECNGSTRFDASINYLNDGKLVYENGIDKTIDNKISVPYTLPTIVVFGMNRTIGIDYLSKGRLYGLKISDGASVIHDFIPVRVGTVGYLYDKVSGKLLRNQGTGAFVVGPDKAVWTNPYATDGLIAMWDGEWNTRPGSHDSNSASWNDLIWGRQLTLNGTAHFGANYMETSDERSGAISDFRLNPQYVEIVYVCTQSDMEWYSLLDDVNSKWMWCFANNGVGVNDVHWNNSVFYADTPDLYNNKIVVIQMSFDGSVCRINNTNHIATYESGEDGVGAFSIFGNVNNIGEDACCHGRCYSCRIYSSIPSQAQIEANYQVDAERFGIT